MQSLPAGSVRGALDVVVKLGLALIAALLLVVIAGAMLGAFGLKSDDDVASGGPGTVGEPIDPPADGSYAIVLGTHRTESGFSLFGWHIGGSERRAHVAFVPPAGCVAPPSGPLAAEGACAGIPVEGDVSGGGTTSDGHDLVIVSVEVSEACQEALEYGARWPSSLPECTG